MGEPLRVSAAGPDFGEWLRRRRADLDLTQEALAQRSGVAVRTVRAIESGRTGDPRPQTRRLIIRALDEVASLRRGADARPDTAARGDGRPAKLPLDPPAFCGRRAQLQQLDRIRDSHAGTGPLTFVISGPPGVGKTALAVRWAHLRAPSFPDGVLHADLHGFSASVTPRDPAEVLREFVETLGMPRQQIPNPYADLATLYGRMLADRRMLVVLDNARDADQVRDLLPAAPGCVAIVTSRRQLAGLVVTDGAHPVVVDPCEPDEGRDILVARVGAGRVSAEPEAADEILRRCGGLPLALAVVGARAALHPQFRLESLAAELRDAHNRLDALGTGEPRSDVRSTISWSYAALSEPAARTFRAMGVHPLPDVTVGVLAGALAVSVAVARAGLTELARANLVAERVPGRYVMHDLLHAYARELIDADEEPDRRDIVDRLREYYAATADGAGELLCVNHRGFLLESRTGVRPETFAGSEAALAWFAAEHEVLLAVLADAARSGDHAACWSLGSPLSTYFNRTGHWTASLAVARQALESARQLDLPLARFHGLRLVARGHAKTGDHPVAEDHYRQALAVADELHDPGVRAMSLFDLAILMENQGRYAESADYCTQVLDLRPQSPRGSGEAAALNTRGWARLQMGDVARGMRDCERALVLHRRSDDLHGQAATLDSVGLGHHLSGRYADAAAAYRDAVEMARKSGDPHLEATVLGHLGTTHERAGDLDEARAAWHVASSIMQDVYPAQAQELRERLADLDRRAAGAGQR